LQAIWAHEAKEQPMETPPIVVDLINGVILSADQDEKAREKYEQIVAAQRQAVTTAGRSQSQK
jgi:hypothetical protein